jgi:glycosyltransferase involved in cell wall biosynthesis
VNIAVVSLTRDRFDYTKHCFASLQNHAGCDYDHYVLDQGSSDQTPDWLHQQQLAGLVCLPHNIGISRGLNRLLDETADRYDVIVKVDNDCELVTPNTLRDIAQLTLDTGWILGPVMHGYGTPLISYGEVQLREHTVSEKHQIQGCFLAATGEFYKGFRYSESNPVWGGDDPEVCRFHRRHGGHVGQVQGYDANHYETTIGQEARYPDYFARKVREGLPWPA